MPKLIPPTHPGDVLFEDFMRPMSLTVDVLAAALRVTAGLIAAIVAGQGIESRSESTAPGGALLATASLNGGRS